MLIMTPNYWGCAFQWWRHTLDKLDIYYIPPNAWECEHYGCDQSCPLYNVRNIDGFRG